MNPIPLTSDWERFQTMLAELPLRRARFVKEFVVHGIATKAAEDAGYALTSAHVTGCRLLKNDKVVKAIGMAVELRDRERGLDKQFVVDKLIEMVAICSRQVPVLDRKGNVVGYEMANASATNKALELLGKTLGIFTDVQEHRGRGGGAIEVTAVPMSADRMMQVARILSDIGALPVIDVPAEVPSVLPEPVSTPVEVEGPVREAPEKPEKWDWEAETARGVE